MIKKEFNVTGMTCSACSSRVEKSVSELQGTQNVSVNLLTNRLRLEYDESIVNEDMIIQAVENAGYGAFVKDSQKVKSDKDSVDTPDNQIRELKIRFLGSLVCLLPLMYISMNHMLYEWFGLPVPTFITAMFHGNENVISSVFAQFLLLLPIIYLNRKYFQVGFKLLLHRNPNMDSLIALGSAAATLYGIVVVFILGYGLGHGNVELVNRYGMDVYFESAGTILTLITLGKYLEAKAKGKTSTAIEKLIHLAPDTALVLRNGEEKEIPIEEVVVGDTFLVKPGAGIPVDGIVLEGSSSVNESAITGESIPIAKKARDPLIAATINGTGFIKARATQVGEDTTLSKIIRLVDEASSSKAPISKLADKIAGVFVPIVIGIAVAAVVFWLLYGATFAFALSMGISVLVISCPCALGLATPVAIMVGTGKGAENGILIKSGEALEIAHSIDTVVLDKTGTITEGKPVVTDVFPIGISEDLLLRIAAALENSSEHPLAEAVVNYSCQRNISIDRIDNFVSVPGMGVAGSLDGKEYIVGNTAFLQTRGIRTDEYREQYDLLAEAGKTPLLFADAKQIIGIIAVADMEKPTSKESINLLQKMQLDVIMLTGDNARTAHALKNRIGIKDAIANVLPQDKEQKVAEIQRNGHKVAMVGDGINDAPALVRADVGIAIGAGTDVAIESADIVLMKNDLLDVVTAIKLSKAVIRNIKENLFWAFFYNSLGIPLAAGVFYPAFGWKLSPMFAAAAMSLSSVCVVSNALRLKLFKVNRNPNDYNADLVIKNTEDEIMKNCIIKINGMMCEHCERHVTKALNKLDGVKVKAVSHKTGEAEILLTKEVSQDILRSVIEDADYEVVSIAQC
jgi:Cu+-exporting ATPase